MHTTTDTTKRLIGYARVSTKGGKLRDGKPEHKKGKKEKQEHGTASQTELLLKAGVARENLFQDIGESGAKKSRPQFDLMCSLLRPGDTVVFYRLDRIARSLRNLLDLVDDWTKRGIHFRSLSEPLLDTTSPTGRLVIQILGAIAEFERSLTIDRVHAGLAAARGRGTKLGPHYKVSDRQMVLDLVEAGHSAEHLAKKLSVSTRTAYRMKRALKDAA
jgi:DNA invertase Pin-like site-specific DNA recombinase